MTNTEKYLNELNSCKAVNAKYSPKDIYFNFVLKVCEHAINNCDLADYDDVAIIDENRVSYIELSNIEKASIIWLIQYATKNDISIPVYSKFFPSAILNNVATGWIRKNIEVTNDYRTAILTHPIYDDNDKLWRYYDIANITFMDTSGVPMTLLNDRELPLTDIHGLYQKTLVENAPEFEYVDTTLFKFKTEDTDEMAARRIKLMEALTYFTFMTYPQATLKWLEKKTSTPVLPDDILADALIVANRLMSDTQMEEFSRRINDYNDEYIDNIIKMTKGVGITDDLLARFNRVQEYLHSLYVAVWETVKEVGIKKNENK